MSIELADAYVSIIPSARGLAAAIGSELAPAAGLAQAQGDKAGAAFSGRFGKQLTTLLPGSFQGINFAGLFAAAIPVGIGIALVKVGEAFANVRHQIEQETGATGTALTGLFDTVKREALTVPASLGDITSAVDELQRRGVPLGQTLDKLAAQELFLAKITKSDLATNVDLTTGLFAKFNVPLRDQSRELDVLFKAQQASGKGLEPLIDSLIKGGAQLQLFGFNLDQSTALIAGLERAGVNVQPVLFSLRTAFAKIAKEGGDPKTVLQGIFKELTDGKNPTLAMADAIKLFGARGGTELARAIQQGKLNVDELLKTITNGKDGIVATGKATESLGDKFLLLKNRALVGLEPIGSAVLRVFNDIVSQAGPVFGDLLGSISHFASAALPLLIPVGLAAEGLFKGALPVMRLFADDLDTVAGALGKIPGPVKAGAAVMGLLALAATGAADGLLAAGAAAATSAAEFAFTPVGAAVILFGALVTAVTIFGHHSDAAKKEATDLGKALFDASSDATLFASGISDASDGLQSFLRNQIASGQDKTLKGTLLAAGTNVAALSKHLDDSDSAWKRYAKSVVDAAGANSHWSSGVKSLFDGKLTASLNTERTAWQDSAKAILGTVVANGQLKQSDIDAIEQRHKNADGTLRYGEIIDAVNKKLGTLAQQTDATAQSVASSSPVYSALVGQFATGAISADTFAGVLQNQFKFSAQGAKDAVKSLGDQIKSFGSEIDKAFPAVSDAAKGLTTDVSGAAADLISRQGIFTRQYKVLTDQGGQASQKMRDAIVSNNDAIRGDLAKLAADTDPQKFTTNLVKQAQQIANFFGNLHTLIAEGFPVLARQLLDLGAQAGGNLAAGFATDKNKAAAGEAAAEMLNTVKGRARAQALADFSDYQGIGHLLPQGVASGITGGKSAVSSAAAGLASSAHTGVGTGLFGIGANAGAQLDLGFANGIISNGPLVQGATSRLVDGVKHILGSSLVIKSPSQWARDFIGKNIVLGIAQGLDPKPLTPALMKVTDTIKTLTAPKIDFSSLNLPTFSTAIQNFSSALTSALDEQISALATYHAAYRTFAADKAQIPVLLAREAEATELLHATQLRLFSDTLTKQPKSRLDVDAAAVANAQKALDQVKGRLDSARGKLSGDASAIGDAAKALADARKALSDATDLGKFNAGLRASNVEVVQFQASLSKLTREGLKGLAAKLAAEGPDAAGRLAALFAKNLAAARAAAKALAKQLSVDAALAAFEQKAGLTSSTAAAATGSSIGADLLKGITDFLKAGGNARTVTDTIKRIIGTAGTAATSTLKSQLATLEQLKSTRTTVTAASTNVVTRTPATQPVAPVVPLTFIRQPAPAPVVPAKPLLLEIEIVSAENVFKPIHTTVDLTGQQKTRMVRAVIAKAQAIGVG